MSRGGSLLPLTLAYGVTTARHPQMNLKRIASHGFRFTAKRARGRSGAVLARRRRSYDAWSALGLRRLPCASGDVLSAIERPLLGRNDGCDRMPACSRRHVAQGAGAPCRNNRRRLVRPFSGCAVSPKPNGHAARHGGMVRRLRLRDDVARQFRVLWCGPRRLYGRHRRGNGDRDAGPVFRAYDFARLGDQHRNSLRNGRPHRHGARAP